jgi:Amt family ammonium transporter
MGPLVCRYVAVGSFVERMKFSSVMWYCTLWMFAVYFPACHMVWGPDGFMVGALYKL